MTYYSAQKTTITGFADKIDGEAGFFCEDKPKTIDVMLTNEQALSTFASHKMVGECLVGHTYIVSKVSDNYDSISVETKVCDPVAVKAILDQLTQK